MKIIYWLLIFACTLTACAPAVNTTLQSVQPTKNSSTLSIPTSSPQVEPSTETPTPTPIPPSATNTLIPLPTDTNTPIPVVESLKAKVIAEKFLSCRYGPGAEYLYLYALNRGANIELIGRTDGNNWVMVAGKNRCWVNTNFLDIAGDPKTLKVMYPDGYKIPVSPYYSPPIVLSALRDIYDPNKITVKWTDISLRPGDEEDENMFIYIIEVWRCEGGQMIFDPLAANYPEITFIDQPGCAGPSHGRVYFQEKHGYAGPADIPWPGY